LSPGASGSRARLVVGLAFFVVTAGMGWSVLAHAHLHEDAYILLKYARHLTEGHGITYWPGGPPTEGATDFLWMAALALAHRLGLDLGLAAVLGNALGAAAIGFVAARWTLESRAAESQRQGVLGVRVLALFPSVALLFLGPACAAYLGFGTLAYLGLIALLWDRAVEQRTSGRGGSLVPWLALAVGLFRPDGVFVGGAFTVLALVAAVRTGRLRRILGHAAGAAAVGASYFAWRWWYFGLPLPLPLYVKSAPAAAVSWSSIVEDSARALPGWESTRVWLTSAEGPLPMLAAAILVGFLVAGASGAPRRRSLALLVTPGVVLVAALLFAHQTQNIGSRFQSPLLLLSVLTLGAMVGRAGVGGARAWIGACVAALSVVPALHTSLQRLDRLWASRGYADRFGPELGRVLAPARTLALTEAGRLAYWTDARVEDLVGLNSAWAAVRPVRRADLEELRPDVVQFYAGPFRLDWTLPPGGGSSCSRRVTSVARSCRAWAACSV
jgi:hypothetical protein